MRVNLTLAVTAGTPVNLAVAAGLVANAAGLATANPIYANRIDVQMGVAPTTAGYGYYMDLAAFPAGTTASAGTAGHVTQQLGINSTTAPGAIFTDAPAGAGVGGARDLTRIWVDVHGANNPVVVSFDLRV